MRNKYSLKSVFIAVFLLLLAVPYFMHISQDLPAPALWDEATIHLNAKDIVLFGLSSLKGERLNYVVFPIQTLTGLLSFSLLGVSLFSLRLPYILLNVLGNILFFDIVRRTRGLIIAAITTAAFAFYAPRFCVGKSAMQLSSSIPLVIILVWCFLYIGSKPRVYFWLGILGMLIFWAEIDQVFVPLFITGMAIAACLVSRKRGESGRAKEVITFYLFGTSLVALIWLGFYIIVGWKNVLFYFSWIFAFESWPEGESALSWAVGPASYVLPWKVAKPLLHAPQLLVSNVRWLYEDCFGFFMATALCLVPFIISVLCSKKERSAPLSLAIYLLLFLLIGKASITAQLFLRRIAPCYALPFLLMAYVAGFLIVPRSGSYLRMRAIKAGINSLLRAMPALLCVLFLTYVCYRPHMLKVFFNLMVSPTYELVREAQIADSIMGGRYKAIVFDGRFHYIALQSPIKFIELPPDLNEKEFYQKETNPSLARKVISERSDIGYAFFRDDNPVIMRMIEDEFRGELIANNVADNMGVLYWLPPRSEGHEEVAERSKDSDG